MEKETTDVLNRVSTMRRQILSLQPLLGRGRNLVVGTLHDQKGLTFIKKTEKNLSLIEGVDVLEVRLDSFPLTGMPTRWMRPVIVTARHPAEGGVGNLSQSKRRELLESSLPWASALDIELRSAVAMSSLISRTHQQGKTLILSHHDFVATPTPLTLKKLAFKAADHGADLFKVATLLRDRHDLLRLLDLQTSNTPIPIVAMGMGAAGRFSRIVLAGFGTPLCYGWLGSPQVSGQWPALELREVLDQILPS